MARALALQGIDLDLLDLVASLCGSDDEARGLRRAAHGLVYLAPPARATTIPVIRAMRSLIGTGDWPNLDKPPWALRTPLARYLATVASHLPADLAFAIFCGLHRQRPTSSGGDAGSGAYTLYLAAQFLARPEQAAARKAWPTRGAAGVCADLLPLDLQDSTVRAYRGALGHALGLRAETRPRPPHPVPAPACARAPAEDGPARLQAALDRPRTPGPGDDTTDPDETPDGHRRPGPLSPEAALGIPRNRRDGPPTLARGLLRRLQAADVSEDTRDGLRAAFQVMYVTGWAPTVLLALGHPEGVTVTDALIHVDARLYHRDARVGPAGVWIHTSRAMTDWLTRVITPGPGLLVRVHGERRPLELRDVHRALRTLNQGKPFPMWVSDLAGAIWHVGRAEGWPPEDLALLTAAWDPIFTRAFGYAAVPTDLDATALYGRMSQQLNEGGAWWAARDARSRHGQR